MLIGGKRSFLYIIGLIELRINLVDTTLASSSILLSFLNFFLSSVKLKLFKLTYKINNEIMTNKEIKIKTKERKKKLGNIY